MKRAKTSMLLTRAMLALALLLCAVTILLFAFAVSRVGIVFQVVTVFFCLVAGALLMLPVTDLLVRKGPLFSWAVLSILCLAVKLFWVLTRRVPIAGDYEVFWGYANMFAEAQGPLEYGGGYMALFPHIFGYSTFLSAFLRVFGAKELLAPILNVLLSVCSGTILFQLCRRWSGLKGAVWVYLLWAFFPSQTMYNSLVLSEPLYTTLILLLLLALTEAETLQEDLVKKWWAGPLIGAGLGLLLRWINGIRPVSAILLIALVIWLILLKETPKWRLWLPLLAVLLAVYSATGSLWNGWIARTIGMEPATTPGYNILVGFNETSEGTWNQEDSDLLYWYFGQPGATAQWAQEQMLGEAKARITSGEIDFPLLFLRKLGHFLAQDSACVGYETAILGTPQRWTVLCNSYYGAALLAAIGGVLVLWRREETGVTLIVPLFFLGLTMAHMLVEVAGRYHYSLIPMLLLMAQYFWNDIPLPQRKKKVEKGSL